jgi:hypothetical protein
MRIGVVCGAAVVAAVVASFASAAGITLTAGPTVSDCGGQAVAPSSLTLTCADANYGLAAMKWVDWGSAQTVGAGSVRANNCTPNCAAGTFQSYPVLATASAVATCLSGRKQYTRLVLKYPSSRPKGIGVTDTWKFPCDAAGPGPTITTKAAAKSRLTLTGSGWQKGFGCKPTVSVGFADKPTPFASAKVGANYGFKLTLVAVRAGAVVVARQTCTTAAVGARLYESALTVKS